MGLANFGLFETMRKNHALCVLGSGPVRSSLALGGNLRPLIGC